jgi:hypothetical protein
MGILVPPGALSRKPGLAVEDRRLLGKQTKLELSRSPGRRQHLETVSWPFARRPIFVGDVQPALGRRSDAGKAQVSLLLVAELVSRDVGPGEVREVQIANSEERELKSVAVAGAVAEVPRPVPPFDRSVGVRAVVPGKGER